MLAWKQPAIHTMKRPLNDPSAQATKRTGSWRNSPDKTTRSVNQHGTPRSVSWNDAGASITLDSPVGLTASQVDFLSLRILPYPLTAWGAGTLLGITVDDVSHLIQAEVLTPLNQGTGTKAYFPLGYVMSIREDYEKLSQISQALIQPPVKPRDNKYAAARRECTQVLRTQPNATPGIPGLACKPGTGTALRTPVPANLDIPDVDPRNPVGMSAEQVAFLCMVHLPAILNSWQTATLLGVADAHIPRLVRGDVLEPLVSGRGIAPRFALPRILSIREDYGTLHAIANLLVHRSL